MKETKNIWNRWYMIVLYCFIALIIGLSMTSTQYITDDCSTVEYQLETCKQLGLQMVDSWDEYQLALDDYCAIDYTNLLCITLGK